ncbi:hypothetical protein BDZ89DRAFT_700557 [Hymenopellis radicata]|nr:hypothetical protein BDZ89DRAFT_700497 [Hymenopellis radicata]KAF9029717.1 hypothetical protein BDZ89DRAFT_700557 [Hymenopellis radicata]
MLSSRRILFPFGFALVGATFLWTHRVANHRASFAPASSCVFNYTAAIPERISLGTRFIPEHCVNDGGCL